MPARFEQIGSLVRKGVLLFSGLIPIPAASLVAALGAAVVSKTLEIHDRRISEALSQELSLAHVAYVEPDDAELLRFYSHNPLYPNLASQFKDEIERNDLITLRRAYKWLYSALILKREIPALLFHQDIESGNYRKLAAEYEELAQGFDRIQGMVKIAEPIDHFGADLWEVVNAAYEAAREELKDKDSSFAFDVVDYIREVATT
ncbi:MAG TPA: hypothetical protein VFG11_10500 [Acidobacteriota bacterium]|nr:hypothetical protein [Acidobacteriota bacterium]